MRSKPAGLGVLLAIAGCGGSSSSPTTPQESTQATSGSFSAPVVVTHAEAGSHGFPPVAFSVELGATNLRSRPPPPGWIAVAYGPPNGVPLTMLITSLRKFDALSEREHAIRERLADYDQLSLNGWTHVMFGGAGRDALELVTGRGERTSWCAIFVERHAATLLVVYGKGGSARCNEIVGGQPFSTITQSFVLH